MKRDKVMKAKIQHTPGPWEFQRSLAGEHNKDLAVWGQNGDSPQAVLVGLLPRSKADIRGETQKANARLIAASPELLKALEFLVQGSFYSDNTGYYHTNPNAIIKARKAISKAKGEA